MMSKLSKMTNILSPTKGGPEPGPHKFYMVRHAEPSWNWKNTPPGMHYSIAPGPDLSEKGKKQAAALAAKIAALAPDRVIASNLVRAIETAKLATGKEQIEINVDLSERRSGETRERSTARAINVLKDVMRSDKTTIIFTHGGLMGDILIGLGVSHHEVEDLRSKQPDRNLVAHAQIIEVEHHRHGKTKFRVLG